MNGSQLDLYLSLGYFRMHQKLFTCRYLYFDDTIFPVHWLRFNLTNLDFKTKQHSLLRRNSVFSVEVKPFVLTEEIKALYSVYRSSVDFDAPESVEFWLYNEATYNIFETYAVEVRDQDRLIAVGIFDEGNQSIAGIMNFYDPEYRKYSLGKYLMLQKISYAQRQQKLYYYPGYIVSNYPKFDYKLFPSETNSQVFDDNNCQWLPFSWETVKVLAAEVLDEL
jgi:arginyl-tRNA--protein-N-Asp/Glu arginylyltransferase